METHSCLGVNNKPVLRLGLSPTLASQTPPWRFPGAPALDMSDFARRRAPMELKRRANMVVFVVLGL